ncbi:uncharacterized protein DSM5745_07409 [Aspergillus mulundensis]|uniref:Uncharacterized protein n=1 Tax=Aspergillus mulundensis TaxID=1810919 RepID=A0A3D8RL22_9EURO|nr:Uncharacterized protein DSM5745_07409 [Aspergillus mulundensis]RDW74747.1 Uncharacterized protein DSM5745_07409 [Aspergillus mulundensis]
MKLSANEPEHALEDDYRMALATAHFERDFDRVNRHTIQLLDAERGRTNCMERLLLRIENEHLQMQVNRTGLELIQAREIESNTRLDLEDAVRELDRLKDLAQASSREIDNLRHELASLNTVASDTQKLQAEKVRLIREISSIRSEVEELRSQNASANALLTEKQEMSRQLNALELQLENEKRAHERALAKESQQTDEVAALTAKLDEARRELGLARRYRQEGIQHKGSALMANSTPASGKRKGINPNLVTVKDRHLEDTQVQQQEGWSTITTTKVPIERPDGPHPRKATSRLHSDLTIATPGAVRAQPQQKPLTTLPGEKSSFSITPFLNRTTGGLEETSTSSDDELNEDSNAAKDRHRTNSTAFSRQLMPSAAKQPNDLAKRVPLKTAVDEDTRNRQKRKVLGSPEGDGGYQTSLSHPVGQKQILSKKRKLGLQRDRSLFDEDEDEITLQDTRKLGRKLLGAVQPSLTGNRAFTGPVGFSPLKRDRKRF